MGFLRDDITRAQLERLERAADVMEMDEYDKAVGALCTVGENTDKLSYCGLGVLTMVFHQSTGKGWWRRPIQQWEGAVVEFILEDDHGVEQSYSGTMPYQVADWYGMSSDVGYGILGTEGTLGNGDSIPAVNDHTDIDFWTMSRHLRDRIKEGYEQIG